MARSAKKSNLCRPKLLSVIALGALAAGVVVALLVKNDTLEIPSIAEVLPQKANDKVTILVDSSCGTCVDISQSPALPALGQSLSEDDFVVLDVAQQETYRQAVGFIEKHQVAALPAIFVGAELVENAGDNKIFAELAQAGIINLSETQPVYEIFTFGNKRVIDTSKIPPLPEDGSIVIQHFIDPFCTECVAFVREDYPQIKEQYGVGINTLITAAGGEPAMFAGEAAVCAYQAVIDKDTEAADKDAAFDAYITALEDIQAGQKEYTEALRSALEVTEITKREEILRTSLNEIVSADIAACLEAHEGLPVVGAQIQLAQQIGIVGTPAYFVGDRFLAGPQTAESIGRALDEFAAEIQATQAQTVGASQETEAAPEA